MRATIVVGRTRYWKSGRRRAHRVTAQSLYRQEKLSCEPALNMMVIDRNTTVWFYTD